jgi:hypothetical protein
MLFGMASHTAQNPTPQRCPMRHGIPNDLVSHAAQYPTRHGSLPGGGPVCAAASTPIARKSRNAQPTCAVRRATCSIKRCSSYGARHTTQRTPCKLQHRPPRRCTTRRARLAHAMRAGGGGRGGEGRGGGGYRRIAWARRMGTHPSAVSMLGHHEHEAGIEAHERSSRLPQPHAPFG